MPRKSSIQMLPKDVLARLNAQIADGTRTLDQLVAWLDEQGHERSRSALGRHAQKIEQVQARLRQSREITEAVTAELGDASTQGKQGRLLVEMTRTLVFDMLVKLQELDENGDPAMLDPKSVAFLGKGLAELGRALRLDQDFETKVRDQVAKEEREAAAKRADGAAKKAGISDEARRQIEEEILGLKR